MVDIYRWTCLEDAAGGRLADRSLGPVQHTLEAPGQGLSPPSDSIKASRRRQPGRGISDEASD